MQPNEITEVLSRPISQELLARDITRLAYVAKDGTPRTIPIAFTWNGSEIIMCTTKNAPKLPALRNNPTVALTIDTEVHPPKILLIRGQAELDFVDGIPEEYLQANSTYEMTPEQRGLIIQIKQEWTDTLGRPPKGASFALYQAVIFQKLKTRAELDNYLREKGIKI